MKNNFKITRKFVFLICIILILSLSFTSANLFSDFKETGKTISNFWNKITGKATVNGWTEWFDRDNPSGSGDYELLKDIRTDDASVCENPIEVECKTINGLDYSETGEVVNCSLTNGLVCKNSNQPDGKCSYDYKIRFNCGDEIIPEINCFDSDGQNYYSKGYGYDYKNYFPNNPLRDKCSDSNYLKEAICSPTGSENIIYKNYFCQYGCEDGACKTRKCFDSDGQNYSSKGYGYDYKNYFPNNPLRDKCSDSNYLKEAICSPTGSENIIYKNYFCQYGCEDGACIQKSVNISIATLKDEYKVGEKIELTDPPETGMVVGVGEENVFYKGDSEGVVSKSVYKADYDSGKGYFDYSLEPSFKRLERETSYELTEEQINELKKLNKEKVKKNKEFKKIKIEIKETNWFNKFFLDLKKNKVEKNLREIEKNLNGKLKEYKVSKETQEELNKVNEEATTWEANYNPKFFKSYEYKKGMLGLKIPENFKFKSIDKSTDKSIKDGIDLPDFFDWRNHNNLDYLTPIKDQGSCGSCWAFAVLGAIEGEANAYYNNINLDANLSEQDLVSCYAGDGCNGNWVDLALDYIVNNKVADEDCFPYLAENGDCANKCSNWLDDAWGITNYENIELGNIEAIKQALVEKGPIVTGMAVYDDFFSYDSGIYSHTTENLMGYHAVVIVGYGVEDGATYWIVKNSWGEDWGEDGYFRIWAGDSGIDNFLLHAIELPIPPTTQNKLCFDNDNDNYCSWGLGDKPNNCPSCHATIEDCDDSDNSIYENCGMSDELTGTLSVTSVPDEADVYVKDLDSGSWSYGGNYIKAQGILEDWVHRGKTNSTNPLIFDLNIGEREIKITKEDYFDSFDSVNIVDGQTTNLNLNLKLAPKLIYPLDNDIYRAGDILEINGTVPTENEEGGGFQNYILEYEEGEEPAEWFSTGIALTNGGTSPVTEDVLGTWNTSGLEKGFYTIRLIVNYLDGTIDEKYIQDIYLDPTIKQGWPQTLELLVNRKSEVTLEDINNDNYKEIIMPSSNKIFAFKDDGSQVSGWPLSVDHLVVFPPAIGDIDNDGIKDVIVSTSDYDNPELYRFDAHGNKIWEKEFESDEWSDINCVTLSDLNNNGLLEIIVGFKNKLYVLNENGEEIWSREFGGPLFRNINQNANCVVVSNLLKNNEGKELIFRTLDSLSITSVHVLDKNGQSLIEESYNITYIYNIPSIVSYIKGDNDVALFGTILLDNDTPTYIVNSKLYEIKEVNGGLQINELNEFENYVLSSLVISEDYILLGGSVWISGWVDNLVVVDEGGTVLRSKNSPFRYLKAPLLSDLNDDGISDIFYQSYGSEGRLLDGNTLETMGNFPPLKTTFATFAIGDLDNNNKPEIVSCGDGIVIVRELSGKTIEEQDLSWPMFMHDPQHTGCYGCEETLVPEQRPQSKIVNNNNFNVTGNLIMKLQKKTKLQQTEATRTITGKQILHPILHHPLTTWQDIKIVTNQSVTIPANDLIKLDVGGDYGWNLQNVKANSKGDYRVYVGFTLEQGSKIETSWEFVVGDGFVNYNYNLN